MRTKNPENSKKQSYNKDALSLIAPYAIGQVKQGSEKK